MTHSVNDKFIIEKYEYLKNNNLIPEQDHNYILDIMNSAYYGYFFDEHKIALYLGCAVCNSLLIRTVGGLFKFNSHIDGHMDDDTDELHKFLTCKENIIKNIIE